MLSGDRPSSPGVGRNRGSTAAQEVGVAPSQPAADTTPALVPETAPTAAPMSTSEAESAPDVM